MKFDFLDKQESESCLWMNCRRRGLIPGDSESLEAFKQRISRRAPLVQEIKIPEVAGALVDWVTISHAGERLYFWEGAITQADAEGHTEIVLGRGTLFCSEQQMLMHELLHSMREAFEMHVFEELLAWRTHPSRLLQYLALFALDVTQLLLSTLAIIGLAIFACSDIGPSLVLISLLPLMLRIVPLLWVEYSAGKALEKRGMPAQAAMLHFSYRELVALSWRQEHFWHDWESSHPFRDAYLKATLSNLHDAKGLEIEDAPTAISATSGDAAGKLPT